MLRTRPLAKGFPGCSNIRACSLICLSTLTSPARCDEERKRANEASFEEYPRSARQLTFWPLYSTAGP